MGSNEDVSGMRLDWSRETAPLTACSLTSALVENVSPNTLSVSLVLCQLEAWATWRELWDGLACQNYQKLTHQKLIHQKHQKRNLAAGMGFNSAVRTRRART